MFKRKKFLSMLLMALAIGGFNSTGYAEDQPKVVAKERSSWQEFHATSGRCSVHLPALPEHISEKIQMPDSEYVLNYDAYISDGNHGSVYMLLIAQYPEFVDESYAQTSLEAFLNGILSYNPANQLIFADLALVDGHEVLEFFIKAGSVFFKGRALLVKNCLYLMAMECDAPAYDEAVFSEFVGSFNLKH